MARSLASVAFNSVNSTVKTKVALGLGLQRWAKYSTRTGGDSDTHEDFRPASNLGISGISVHDVVQQDVKENPVMVYMKGVPDAPQCGFSALAVKVLQHYGNKVKDLVVCQCHAGVPISARNILENPELKEGVKAYSNWPTFPQVFIKGEFVGGSDIVLNMHQNGELKELLVDIGKESGES
ncbi:Monothiol glutaredoxin-S4, mitochondrial [Ananas comosus]|uniref:Monothiol glutaredoxin-S4, mitochondrial n=1 Tax=Ananas comosus TaxID=4615 RepID=A0A199W0B6_ANACO|nr:Monothiol glutaredoxin-S4, mitochondrial [Ananas comosus]